MIPDEIQNLISAGASVTDVRRAILKEIDRDGRRTSSIATQIAVDANQKLGGKLLEEDDGVVDFTNRSDPEQRICEVTAAMRMNFSLEKIRYAGVITDLLRGNRSVSRAKSETYKSKQPDDSTQARGTSPSCSARQEADSLTSGIETLYQDMKSDKLTLVDFKQQLARLILKELDRDQRRDPMLAVRVANEANDKLVAAGESLYEMDDGAVVFPQAESPVTREDKLDEVKAALRLNFSREKIEYAEALIRAFRTRGLDGFQVKNKINANASSTITRQTTAKHSQSSSHHRSEESYKSDASSRGPSTATASSSGDHHTASVDRHGMSAKITWAVVATVIATLLALVIRKFK